MARIARVVVAGVPHHIVQRGNRRQKVFFKDEDRIEYLRMLKEQAQRYEVSFWAYCLMDNHVHLIAVPMDKDSLARTIGETHRRYTRMINFREGWRGYLWQGRFSSFALDERYLYAAVRYVERNPVRAGIVAKAEDYVWSSAQAHVSKQVDPLLSNFYLQEQIADWSEYLSVADEEKDLKHLRRHGQTGRPLGDQKFIGALEAQLGVRLARLKPGPKRKLN